MKKLFVIILVGCLPFSFGQDTLNLNLEKCIDLAIQYNHDLKIAELDYQKADEQITEAFGSAVLPTIKGEINYRRALKRGVVIIETPVFSGSFPQGTENTMTVGATLEQPLFTGAVFYATRISKVYAEIAENGYYSSKANLIRDVKRAYYGYLYSQEFSKLSQVTLQAAKDNLKNTQALFDAGLAPEYDLIRAQVQVQNILPQLEQAKNAIKLAENALRLIVGLDLDKKFVVNDSLTYTELPVEDYQTSARILDKKNFTLQQLRLQVELQDKNVSYQFSKNYPELYLSGNWQSTAQENDPKSFNNWRYKNSVYVGLNLKVPIFDGWQTTSRVQQAEIDLKKSQENLVKTNRQLNNQLDDILLKIEEAKNRISAYAATIKQAKLGYDISIKRYNNGLGTQLENIDALVAYTQAKANYLEAIYNYYDLHSQLEALLSSEVNEKSE